MTRELNLTTASSVEAAPLRWLWPGYVPQGKVTVLAGAPGLGKSLLTVWLAAAVSKNSDVLMASAEDDPADTIKPRLLAAGANCDRVHLLDVREFTEHGVCMPGIVQLPGDAYAIHERVKALNARLVVLDPVAAFLDANYSAYREQEVRAALAPLKILAEETGAAVVLVMHLNKGDGSDPLRRIGNSGAFTALARSVLVFGSDPEDEEGDRGTSRVLTVAKGNVRAAGKGSVIMRIVERPVEVAGETIAMAVLEKGAESNVSAEDLLGSGEDRTVKGEAMAWLREMLADGPVAAAEVRSRAKDEGHAERTLKRAKAALSVKSVKSSADGGWEWKLPEAAGPLPPPPPGPDGPVGPLGGIEGANGWPPSSKAGPLTPKRAKEANKAKEAKGTDGPADPAPPKDPPPVALIPATAGEPPVDIASWRREWVALGGRPPEDPPPPGPGETLAAKLGSEDAAVSALALAFNAVELPPDDPRAFAFAEEVTAS